MDSLQSFLTTWDSYMLYLCYAMIGVGILILGAMFSLWPEVTFEEAGVFGYVRAAASVAASVVFALLLAGGPAIAYGGTRGPPSSTIPTPALVTPSSIP